MSTTVSDSSVDTTSVPNETTNIFQQQVNESREFETETTTMSENFLK